MQSSLEASSSEMSEHLWGVMPSEDGLASMASRKSGAVLCVKPRRAGRAPDRKPWAVCADTFSGQVG